MDVFDIKATRCVNLDEILQGGKDGGILYVLDVVNSAQLEVLADRNEEGHDADKADVGADLYLSIIPKDLIWNYCAIPKSVLWLSI